jgi:hypothetical protein
MTELWRGRPLGLTMVWEEGGAAAMAWRHAIGTVAVVPALLGCRWKEPVGPKRLSGLVRPARPKVRSE